MALTQVQGGMLAGSTNTTTTIQSNGTTAITIDSSQNVGIGTTTPATKLTVASGGRGRFYRADNTRYGDIYTDGDALKIESSTDPIVINAATGQGTRFQDAGTERMRITGDGNLCIGTTSTTVTGARLTLRGTQSWAVGPQASDSTFYVYNASSQGVYILNGGTSWASSSDERKKDIIEPITDATNKVSQLRAVIGKYKQDPEGTRRSFLIAQDIQKVLPEAVNELNDEDKTLGVQYTDVIPLLVAAIKELKAELDATKAEVAALKAAP